jgi:RHS repeat-associated protein
MQVMDELQGGVVSRT